jgi:alanine dehydrogenase
MPGAVARTSALALNNSTLPFAIALANKGYKKALSDDAHLLHGLNVCLGHITHEAVAHDLGMPYVAPETFLK